MPFQSSNRGVRWKPLLILFLFTSATWASAVHTTKTLITCEGKNARLECTGDSEQISIELANYGRFSNSVCNDLSNPDYNTNCYNNATTLVLANKCNGLGSCEFVVTANLFGDACPGTPKYLDATYTCVHITTTVAPPASPTGSNDGVAPTKTDQVRHSVNDTSKMESCTSVFYREINWPNTPIDKMAKSQCPLDTRGEAFRMCLPSGLWALERDLSGCVSAAFHDLQEQFRDIWSGGYMVTIELIEDVHRFIQTAHLFGGDLIETSRLLYQINKHNSAFTSAYNRKQLSETAKDTFRIINDIFQINHREAWLDLLASEQTRVANRLLLTIEESLRNVVRGIASHKSEVDTFVERPSVLGVAAVARDQNTMELPMSSIYDIEDRALFSLPDSDISREYEIVYSSVGSLGQYLFRAKASKREDGCERTLISNVLSAWVGIRSLDPTEERIPLVLSFSTRKPNPSLQAQCVRWSEQHEDFVEDGSCMVLVHNSTQTICRCMGTGHYAVIGSTCDSQLFVGPNKETVALYASSLFAIFGLLVYLFGLSLVKQNQPKYVFIRRNFCSVLLLAKILIGIWFMLPRHGLWSSLLIYLVHGMVFTVAWWILVQVFQLFYSLVQLLSQRNIGTRFLRYLVGYGFPIAMTLTLVASSGNFELFLKGFQPLQKPMDMFVVGPLALLASIHLVFATLTWYLLEKRFRVGYKPCCQRDADTLSAVRSSLSHLAPLVVAIDLSCFMIVQFSLHPVNVWLWFLVTANIIQTLVTLRVLSFRRLCSGKLFFAKKKQTNPVDLPKNSIFSPIVQEGRPFNYSFNDPTYTKHPAGLFADSQQQIYVPTSGVHLPHDCHCEYATIPPDYYSFYNNQHYRVYQQNPANPSQLQRSIPHLPPIPPIPANGFERLNNDQQMMLHPHLTVDEVPQSPICHQHGSRCASLAALRLSNTQLYHQQQQLPRPPSDGSYETARSSSTSGTSSTVASSGTFLLRMDPKQQNPLLIFLDNDT